MNRYASSSSLESTSESEPTNCYNAIIKYLAHFGTSGQEKDLEMVQELPEAKEKENEGIGDGPQMHSGPPPSSPAFVRLPLTSWRSAQLTISPAVNPLSYFYYCLLLIRGHPSPPQPAHRPHRYPRHPWRESRPLFPWRTSPSPSKSTNDIIWTTSSKIMTRSQPLLTPPRRHARPLHHPAIIAKTMSNIKMFKHLLMKANPTRSRVTLFIIITS